MINTIKIGGIQALSTIDYPGVLSCVVFVCGCNLNCFYCHNRALLSPDAQSVAMQKAMGFLKKRVGLLDGVVISGGEPTLYDDLPTLIGEIKKLGYKVKLDTNGQRPGRITPLAQSKAVDYVAVDLKAPPEAFSETCGMGGLENSIQTVSGLLASGAAFEGRTTLYPGMTAGDLLKTMSLVPPLPRYRLNFFRRPALYQPQALARLNRPCLNPGDINAIMDKIKKIQPNVVL